MGMMMRMMIMMTSNPMTLRQQIERLPRHLLWRLVDRFERHDRTLDVDDEYVRWSDLVALLQAQPSEDDK